MALTKEKKQKVVKDLEEKIEKQKSMVFADFTGVKVKDLSELRKEMKNKDCEFKVAKKTLLKVAFDNKKIGVPQGLEGEIAIGFGYKDPFVPFKILNDFSRKKEVLKILGAMMMSPSGSMDFFESEKAIAIAELPTKDELTAKMVWSLKSPLSGLVNVLQGNLRGLALVLSQIKVTK